MNMQEQIQLNKTNQSHHHYFLIFGIIFSIFVGACFITRFNGTSSIKNGYGIVKKHVDTDYVERELRRKIARIKEKSLLEQDKAYTRFLNSIKREYRYFHTADSHVDEFVNDICSYSSCVKLFCMSLKDRVKHTDNTDKYVKNKLDRAIMRHCFAGHKAMQRDLDHYINTLQQIYRKTNEELCALLDEYNQKYPELNQRLAFEFQRNLLKNSDTIHDISWNSVFASGSLVIGVHTSFALYKVAGRIAGTIGKIATRTLGKSLAISWLPAVDGPLPIGDAIFAAIEAGVIAWDAKALYDARITLRKDLTRNLKRTIRNYKMRYPLML